MIPLLRFDRATGKVTKVASLAGSVPAITGDPKTAVRRSAIPYSPVDGWVSLSSGALMILRGADYRPDLIPPRGGAPARPIGYTPVPISSDERVRLAKSLPPEAVKLIPQNKPAFNPSHLHASPDGSVWVGLYRTGTMRVYDFDELDSTGKKVATMKLPEGRTVVAIGRTRVFLSRIDSDGFTWLECYSR
jgi:hypothetical protein